MAYVPEKTSSSKNSQPNQVNASSFSQHVAEQLNIIKKKFDECIASYVACCEKKIIPADFAAKSEEYKVQVELFTDYLNNLQNNLQLPPLDSSVAIQDNVPHVSEEEFTQIQKPTEKVMVVSGPDETQPLSRHNVTNIVVHDKARTKSIKRLTAKEENVLHQLQTKENDARSKLKSWSELDMRINGHRSSFPLEADDSHSLRTCSLPRNSVLSPNWEKIGVDPKSTKKSDPKPNQNDVSCEPAVDNNNLACSLTGDSKISVPAESLNLEKTAAIKITDDPKPNWNEASSEVVNYSSNPVVTKVLATILEKKNAEPKSSKTKSNLKSNRNDAGGEVDIDNNNLARTLAQYQRFFEKTGAKPKTIKTTDDLKPNRNEASDEVDIDSNKLPHTHAKYRRFSALALNLEKTGAKPKSIKTTTDPKLNRNKASSEVVNDSNNLVVAKVVGSALEKKNASDEVDIESNNLPRTLAKNRRFSAAALNLEKTGAIPKSIKTEADPKPNQNKASGEILNDNPVVARVLASIWKKKNVKPKSPKTKSNLKSNQNEARGEVDIDNNNLAHTLAKYRAAKPKSIKTEVDPKPNRNTANGEVVNDSNNPVVARVRASVLEKENAKPKSSNLKPNQNETSDEVGIESNKLPPAKHRRFSAAALNLEKTGAKPKSIKTEADPKPNRNKANGEVVNDSNNPVVARVRASVLEKENAKPKSSNLKPNQNETSDEVGIESNKLPPAKDRRFSAAALNLEKTGAKLKSIKTEVDPKPNRNKASGEVVNDSNNPVVARIRASILEKENAKPKSSNIKPNQNETSDEVGIESNKLPPAKDRRFSAAALNLEKTGAKLKSIKTEVDPKPNRNKASGEVVNDSNNPVVARIRASILEKENAKPKSSNIKPNQNETSDEVGIESNKLPPAKDRRFSAAALNLEKTGAKLKSIKTEVDPKPNRNKASGEVVNDSNNPVVARIRASILEKENAKPKSSNIKPNQNETSDEVGIESNKLPPAKDRRFSAAALNLEKTGAKPKSKKSKADPKPNQNETNDDIANNNKNLAITRAFASILEKNCEFAVDTNNLAYPSTESSRPACTVSLERTGDKFKCKNIEVNPNGTSIVIEVDQKQVICVPFPTPPLKKNIAEHKSILTKSDPNNGSPAVAVDENQPILTPHSLKTDGESSLQTKGKWMKLEPKSNSNKANFTVAADCETNTSQMRSDLENREVVDKKVLPIHPPTLVSNVQKTGAKPGEHRLNRQRRVKRKPMTQHERRKINGLIVRRRCSYCNEIHPLDPKDYIKKYHLVPQTHVLHAEVPGTSSNAIQNVQFPYLNQHLEACKLEKENNENQIDKSEVDGDKSVSFSNVNINSPSSSNKGFVEGNDDETFCYENSEAENDILDDVTVQAEIVESERDVTDVPKDIQKSKPKKLKTNGCENREPTASASTSHCKHSTDVPEWIDYCPFCDYDALPHAGTVIPEFCKIDRNQTTCGFTVPQIAKKEKIKGPKAKVTKNKKQKVSPNNGANCKANGKVKASNKNKETVDTKGTNKSTSNAKMFANCFHHNLTHSGNKENRYIRKTWLPRPALTGDATEEEILKEMKALREIPMYIKPWEEKFCERVSRASKKQKKVFNVSLD